MKIYLDMDGVIADFFSGLEKKFVVKHWKQIPKIEQSITGLKCTDFFNTLEPFDTSAELVDFVKSIGTFGICSSPLRGDRDNSAFWKRVWLNRHGFMPDEIEDLIFTGNKHQFAVDRFDGTPNILVDDKPDNISRWCEKGGIGIRYQANEDSITTIKRKLNEAVRN